MNFLDNIMVYMDLWIKESLAGRSLHGEGTFCKMSISIFRTCPDRESDSVSLLISLSLTFGFLDESVSLSCLLNIHKISTFPPAVSPEHRVICFRGFKYFFPCEIKLWTLSSLRIEICICSISQHQGHCQVEQAGPHIVHVTWT